MIEKLKAEYELKTLQLEKLEDKYRNCSVCGGTGKHKTKMIDLKFWEIPDDCECYDRDGIVNLNIRLDKIKLSINDIISQSEEQYWNADFNDVDQRIKDFMLDDDKYFLWLHSKRTGTGKTHSLYSLKNYYIVKGKEFKVVHEDKIGIEYGEVTEGLNIGGIDDIGAERDKMKAGKILSYYNGLFDFKYNRKKKLTITSNYSPNEWIERVRFLDQHAAMRIKSRMANNIVVVELTGPDRRVTG